jgi:hypothetical protein
MPGPGNTLPTPGNPGTLAAPETGPVSELSRRLIRHTRHVPYFLHFPAGVPDTVEFAPG